MLALLLLCTLTSHATTETHTFSLWQLPSQTPSQMLSYVIRTHNGKIVVIDGGMAGDAPYLKGFLAALGNRVDAWYITHPHSDHIDALREILNHPGSPSIGRIYASIGDDEWIRTLPQADDPADVFTFEKAVRDAGKTIIDLRLGQVTMIDGVKVEVLAVRNPEIHMNPLNNSSVVLRMSDAAKSVLFLGDLGPEGGEKLLHGKYASRLHADYVQMAHHGQNGVDLPVYQVIKPTYCLWPTPIWLWDNNIGGKGKGTGPWKTLEVRKWMEDLHVKYSYVSAEGLVKIE